MLNNSRDKGHIKYIANRPGVEKTDISADAAHIKYAGNRPRSTGLFGPDPDKPPTTTQAIKDIEDKKNPLSWRLVFSLKEEDSKSLGYVERKDWEELTRRNMEQFAKAIDISYEQLNWVGAYHPEQGHPHVHVLVYPCDESPKRRGQLSNLELRNLRKGVAHEIFGQYSTELAIEKSIARNGMIDTTKDIMEKLQDLEKIVELEMQADNPVGEKLPPRFSHKELEELLEKLKILVGNMPGKGRAALSYMPDEVKKEARFIADNILQKSQMRQSLKQYEKAVRELTRVYTCNNKKADEAWDRAYNDIRDRIANQIIKEAARINKEQQKTGKSVLKDEGLSISRSTF